VKVINLMDDTKIVLTEDHEDLLIEISRMLKSNVLIIATYNCNKNIKTALYLHNISEQMNLPSLCETPTVTIALVSPVYSCDIKTTIKFLQKLFHESKIFSYRPSALSNNQFEFF